MAQASLPSLSLAQFFRMLLCAPSGSRLPHAEPHRAFLHRKAVGAGTQFAWGGFSIDRSSENAIAPRSPFSRFPRADTAASSPCLHENQRSSVNDDLWGTKCNALT